MPKQSNALYFNASPEDEGGKLKRKSNKQKQTTNLEKTYLESKARKQAYYYKPVEILPFAEQARKKIMEESFVGKQIADVKKDEDARKAKALYESQTSIGPLQEEISKQLKSGKIQNENDMKKLLAHLQRASSLTAKQNADIYYALLSLQDPNITKMLQSPLALPGTVTVMSPSNVDIATQRKLTNARRVKMEKENEIKKNLDDLLTSNPERDYKKINKMYQQKFGTQLRGRESLVKEVIADIDANTITLKPSDLTQSNASTKHVPVAQPVAQPAQPSLYQSTQPMYGSTLPTYKPQNPSSSSLLQPVLFTSSSDEEGSGLFSNLKDLAKKGLNAAIEKVKEDPIKTAMEAWKLGNKVREEYVKRRGQKAEEQEKGGRLRIPKKHISKITKHFKIKGGSWWQSLLSGFLTPISAIGKIGDAVGSLGIPGVSDVAKGLGNFSDKVSDLTGVKGLI